MQPLLSVKNLVLHFDTFYGTVKALEGVSFDVGKEEVFGLVGETGCGKTVTSLAVIKLLPENAMIIDGQVIFKGENLLDKSEKEMRNIRGKEISMIFQDPSTSLNPIFKIKDQLLRVILTHQKIGKREAYRKGVNLLKSVGLPDPERLMNSYPFELSGGMQQRIMIAIAISSNPDLLIADEPTSNLDVTIQAQILDLIRKCREETRASVLFITHDFGIVTEMCDRVGVMYAGNMAEIAPLRELLTNPLHPYTRALLPSIPTPSKRGKKLHVINGMVPDLLKPPTGCRFHPRCPYSMDICKIKAPPAIKVGKDHLVSCYLVKNGDTKLG
jgi:oligopeptide/dipeptide ABC transporter ATP-binding protein